MTERHDERHKENAPGERYVDTSLPAGIAFGRIGIGRVSEPQRA